MRVVGQNDYFLMLKCGTAQNLWKDCSESPFGYAMLAVYCILVKIDSQRTCDAHKFCSLKVHHKVV